MARHELSIRSELQAPRGYVYHDFYVNKRRLSDILKISGSITPFGWLGNEQVSRTELEDSFARMLLGTASSDLRSDRVPLFICGECGDYGCGATTCMVTVSDTLVEWSDFGWDNTYEEETKRIDHLLGHHFYFDRGPYEAVFRRYTIKSDRERGNQGGAISESPKPMM